MEANDNVNLGLATILKELEEAVSSASRVPLTNKVMVNEEAIIGCVDKIYAALPDEIKQAKMVLEQSDKLLENVEDQGQRIIAEAKEKALEMTEESAIYQEAAARADAMIAQAEQASNQLRHDSLHYCDDVMGQLEAALDKMLASIRKNREDLHKFSYYDLDDQTSAAEEEI